MAQENLVLDSTIREFLDELAANEGPLVYQLTPDEARSTLVRAQSGTVRKPDAQIKDWNVDSAVGSPSALSTTADSFSKLSCRFPHSRVQ